MSLLEEGTRLGPYVLINQLGEGGIGRVYRARDVRLDREVAVKVLQPSFAADSAWLARFEREARLLASLSHPNIATVHGFDETNDVRYLVMELVPGQTLATRLLRGPLPVAEALEVGRQIAEALEAAHEKGVIHRDLKPGNVMITPEGRVKVLDFGLARQAITGDSPVPVYLAETRAQDPVTVEGTLIGTPAYASPEQARGQRVDRRSDVWALGCVLFEMLTGQKPFTGDTLSDVMAAVLQSDPAWQALPSALPSRATGLIHWCLKKDIRRRLCDAGDARIELTEALEQLASPPPPARPTGTTRRAWLFGAVGLAAGVGAGVLLPRGKQASPPPPLPEWNGENLLDSSTVAFSPRVSPDEKWLAFGTVIEGQTQVAVMNLETGDRFIRTADRQRGMVNGLSWAANSQRIYFDRFLDAPTGIYTATPPGVRQAGGDEPRFIERADCPQVTHDGSLLYCRPEQAGRSRFYLRTPGGEERLVLEHPVELTVGWPPAALRALRTRPEAVFCGKVHTDEDRSPKRRLYLLDLTGKRPPRRLDDGLFEEGEKTWPSPQSVALSPGDEYVYTVLRSGDLYRLIRVPLTGGKPETVWTVTKPIFGLDVDSDGRVYVSQFPQPREILRFTGKGGQPERLISLSRGADMEPIRLPDGRFVLPSRVFGRDRLLLGPPDGEQAPLLEDGSETRHPAALIGRDQLAFLAGPAKKPVLKLKTLAAEAGGLVTTVAGVAADGLTGVAGSLDGKELYYVREREVWRVPIAGGMPRSLGPGDAFALHPRERRLLIQRYGSEGCQLAWVEVETGKRTDVKVSGPLRLAPYPIGSRAIDAGGRLALVCAVVPGMWFWQTATLDLSDGTLRRIPVVYEGDITPANWGEGGEILAIGYLLRSELWRLTPR